MTEQYRDAYATDDRGAGWLFFSGTVLGIAGIMRIIDGLWAFGYEGELPARLQDGVIGSNLTTYGWLWVLVGIVLLASSVLLLTRNQLGRWVGLIAAAVAAISATAWMPYYPIWSMTYILMAMLVLYGLGRWGGKHPA